MSDIHKSRLNPASNALLGQASIHNVHSPQSLDISIFLLISISTNIVAKFKYVPYLLFINN